MSTRRRFEGRVLAVAAVSGGVRDARLVVGMIEAGTAAEYGVEVVGAVPGRGQGKEMGYEAWGFVRK